MKKHKIDTSKGESEKDIEHIYRYIADDSPKNALKWYSSIRKKISTLEEMPERCPEAPESELVPYIVRHLIVGNYRVLFRIEGSTVQVLHVRGKGQEL